MPVLQTAISASRTDLMKKTVFFFSIFIFSAVLIQIIPLRVAYSAPPPLPPSFAKTHEFNKLFSVFSVKEPLHLVLIEKKKQRLLVLRYDGVLQMVASFTCATGENPGKKKISGDSRTPEGIYFITKIFEDSKVTIFGDRALHLDYPNIFDKLSNRNGDGIYIHGTNKKLAANSTNGCVTLTNDDLASLVQYLDMMVTPVVIIDDLDTLGDRLKTVNMIDNTSLKNALIPDSFNSEKMDFDYLYIVNYDGVQAVAVGEFSQRMNAATRLRGYSRAYIHFRGKNDWKIMEKISNTTPIQIFPPYPMKIAAQSPSSQSMGNIVRTSMLPDQEEYARLQGEQSPPPIQVASSEKMATAEKVVPPPAATPAARVTAPPAKEKPSPAASPEPPTEKTSGTPPAVTLQPQSEKTPPASKDHEQIAAFVEQWRAAWESKDIDSYIASYHPNFSQDGMNLRAWRDHKDRLNKNYRFISVKVEDMKIDVQPSGARVTFAQKYNSDRYSATGTKTLYLQQTDGGWRILRELWSKSSRRTR